MLYDVDHSALRAIARAGVFTAEFIGAEMIIVRFRTDPRVVARVLPRPLRPAPEPLATAFVARYPETNFGVSYNEGALFLDASYRGETGMYCLSMPVDDDMAMVYGRELYGFPKKIAEEITVDRDGGHVVGRVVRQGTEILRLEGEFTDEADATHLSFGEPAIDPEGRPCRNNVSFLFKFLPAARGAPLESAPLLIRQATLFRPRPGMMTGVGKTVLSSTEVDPLGDIPVRDVLDATYGIFDNRMLPGRVVRRIRNPLRFAPHALFKNDLFPVLAAREAPPLGLRERRQQRRELAQY